MKKIIFSLIFIVFIVASYAQVGSMFSNPSFAKPDFSFTSLFNPNILTMNHSVSFFSGMDSSKNAFYQSVYTNHLKFKFNPKFSMNLDLNFVNIGTGNIQNNMSFKSNQDNSTMVIPELNMTYKPTENTTISFHFSKMMFMDNNFNSNTNTNTNTNNSYNGYKW
ncbi:MAG: hypothetical protein K8S23_00025 [Candidatus Cloacimonetes bacterium]|nr:hypothetical protein [Candidatus Cloacimonadota bacterium]